MNIWEVSCVVEAQNFKFSNKCDSIHINFPDDKPSHFSCCRMLPVLRSVCNILQIHYERRAPGRKVYRVIHGQAYSKCICAIFVS